MDEPIKPIKNQNVVVDFAKLNTKVADENKFEGLVTISGLGFIRYKTQKLRIPTSLRKTTTNLKKDNYGFWTQYTYLEGLGLGPRSSISSKTKGEQHRIAFARSGCMGDSGGKKIINNNAGTKI